MADVVSQLGPRHPTEVAKQRYLAVTPERVRDFVARYLTRERRVLVLSTPAGEGASR